MDIPEKIIFYLYPIMSDLTLCSGELFKSSNKEHKGLFPKFLG